MDQLDGFDGPTLEFKYQSSEVFNLRDGEREEIDWAIGERKNRKDRKLLLN
jgi:hypothetical protein